MWNSARCSARRFTEFFRIALSHDSLENHFKTNFIMMQHHKYSLTELNEMLPWEREVYIAMLIEYIKEENERTKQLNNKYKV
jgi:3-methyladenine DNA glycosylase AlkD